MTAAQRYNGVITWFQKNMPVAESELSYGSPYELLVAVILSAQCTDKRVNMVTPALFKAFPTAQKMAEAEVDEIYEYIKSISYPNNKAKNLKGMAVMLTEKFKGKVPSDIDTLQELPGVGKKTANVVASIVYKKPVIAVDTHVFRVSRRIGLAKSTSKTPLEVELQLEKNIPEELRATAHHWLILHGRYICVARAPKCDECGLTEWCKYHASLQ
ncbi:MAG: endonuclease III [Prevotellaceae bacterium]|jgi:endonuclease-3|nr:endonuclease III [Prevotellaceae bacterium]